MISILTKIIVIMIFFHNRAALAHTAQGQGRLLNRALLQSFMGFHPIIPVCVFAGPQGVHQWWHERRPRRPRVGAGVVPHPVWAILHHQPLQAGRPDQVGTRAQRGVLLSHASPDFNYRLYLWTLMTDFTHKLFSQPWHTNLTLKLYIQKSPTNFTHNCMNFSYKFYLQT